MHALRYLANLSQTVMFLPLIGLFLSTAACEEDQNGNLVHQMFNELECWKGIHILYAVTGLLSAFVFIILTLVTTFVYFENRQLSGNIMSKVSARAELLDQINKVCCCVFFCVFLILRLPMGFDNRDVLRKHLGVREFPVNRRLLQR